jgi:uncharacterized integral membrane protein (TIGR00697 family)
MKNINNPVAIGIIAMAVVVVLSNILVQYLLGDWLTWAAFAYPVAFLITDVTNRKLGVRRARQVVVSGFIVGVLCSVVASQFVNADGVPLTTLRIAIGSGVAFLAAQLTDVLVFNRFRSGHWWRAPLASTLVGATLDSALFFSIAFSATFAFIDPADPNGWALELVPLLGVGPMLPLWISLGLADYLVKLSLALIALVPFRALTK